MAPPVSGWLGLPATLALKEESPMTVAACNCAAFQSAPPLEVGLRLPLKAEAQDGQGGISRRWRRCHSAPPPISSPLPLAILPLKTVSEISDPLLPVRSIQSAPPPPRAMFPAKLVVEMLRAW